MIDAGILDGDLVVVRRQPDADDGDVVVAGINGEEGTVKHLRKAKGKIVLVPANPRLSPMEMDPASVLIFGKVVTVMRRL